MLLAVPSVRMYFDFDDAVELEFGPLQNAIRLKVRLVPVLELEPPPPAVEPNLVKRTTFDLNKCSYELVILRWETLHR